MVKFNLRVQRDVAVLIVLSLSVILIVDDLLRPSTARDGSIVREWCISPNRRVRYLRKTQTDVNRETRMGGLTSVSTASVVATSHRPSFGL